MVGKSIERLSMDIFTIGWVLAAVGLGGGLMFAAKQRSQNKRSNAASTNFRSNAKSALNQGEMELDPQTRFIETPRRKQYRLLNDSEKDLYTRLREAMPNMQIFAQVGVAQLALLRGRQEAQRLSQMAGRGVDFVVCDQDFAIIAAIELSWPTAGENVNSAEKEKRNALQSLGIPLIVFRPNSLPDAEAISREIADAIIRRNRLEAERH